MSSAHRFCPYKSAAARRLAANHSQLRRWLADWPLSGLFVQTKLVRSSGSNSASTFSSILLDVLSSLASLEGLGCNHWDLRCIRCCLACRSSGFRICLATLASVVRKNEVCGRRQRLKKNQTVIIAMLYILDSDLYSPARR